MCVCASGVLNISHLDHLSHSEPRHLARTTKSLGLVLKLSSFPLLHRCVPTLLGFVFCSSQTQWNLTTEAQAAWSFSDHSPTYLSIVFLFFFHQDPPPDFVPLVACGTVDMLLSLSVSHYPLTIRWLEVEAEWFGLWNSSSWLHLTGAVGQLGRLTQQGFKPAIQPLTTKFLTVSMKQTQSTLNPSSSG